MDVRVSIIGTGNVGAATAFGLLSASTVSELVLVDINKKKAEGEAMDLNHGVSFVSPVEVVSGDYSDCKGSRIVIFTAGANQKPGETRLDLAEKNTAILKQAIPELMKHCPDAILLMVANPVDILTYGALKISGLPPRQVIGSGTVLDSSRLRYTLSRHFGVDVRNVHAYIAGEHGDTEVPLWSLANIAGADLEHIDFFGKAPLDRQALFEETKTAAYHIIERKGATYYAIALAVRRICEAILRDEHSVLTISSLIEGDYGIRDVCLSLPSLVCASGRERILDLPLSEQEETLLRHSAGELRKVLSGLGL
ncbi:l-lactate dehydrogenase [Heliomicrobium modesticaldum Ice1]|uniref:L-lactate dehydrogenase n=1 Tax=Heliobacterium modesticaldum (strain ATCC 51547 / Ice1) TaxID=498761 RepID=B0TC12_HELMI|nr:L-lactate dehydrogenase [Heliomicrobium modesticaldum]ABZ85285.1 l-lactate dehydrogenase [Heliomicrobium modesticaldum Ice1]